ncbi:hypothetical protein, partial [Xanthomonas axonopodis]
LGPIEAILIAEGFGRLVDLLSTPGILGFATAARERLLNEHEAWARELLGGTEPQSVEARLRILQDKLFAEELLRLTISELPNVLNAADDGKNLEYLQPLLVDIYHERDKRHEAHIRLAALFEKAMLKGFIGDISSAPDRPKGVL